MPISVAEYQRRLAPLLKRSAVKELLLNELIKEESNLIYLKEQEFKHGVLPDDKPIGYYRNTKYEKRKRRMNPSAGGRVDLIFSGAFIDSFYLLKKPKNGVLFGASDKKRNALVSKYTINIMGLNKQVFNKVEREVIFPRFVRTIKQRFRIG